MRRDGRRIVVRHPDVDSVSDIEVERAGNNDRSQKERRRYGQVRDGYLRLSSVHEQRELVEVEWVFTQRLQIDVGYDLVNACDVGADRGKRVERYFGRDVFVAPNDRRERSETDRWRARSGAGRQQ